MSNSSTMQYTVNDKSFTVRKLSRFLRIFIKPRKFSLLNFCSSEVQACMKVVMEKIAKLFPAYLTNPANRETFHPRNFCRLRYVILSHTTNLLLQVTLQHYCCSLTITTRCNLFVLCKPFVMMIAG